MQAQKNKSREINWYLCTFGHSYINQNGQDKETFEKCLPREEYMNKI